MAMNERVLVIAPHPDDEVIGCGGAMIEHKEKGDRVFVIYVTSGELFNEEKTYNISTKKRYDEAMKAGKTIGFEILDFPDIPARQIKENESIITEKLENIMRKIMPTTIYFPHDDEKDSDHFAVNRIVKEAYFRSKLTRGNRVNSVKAKLRGYEVWTPIRDVCELKNIEEFVDKKTDALNKYTSQVEVIDYAIGIQGLNSYRGCFFGACKSAEAFTIIFI